MRKRKLEQKLLAVIVLFVMVLVLGANVVLGIQYRNQKLEESSRLAFSYAQAVADHIDGDRIAGYVETGEEDDYYRQILSLLNALVEHSDILFLYVYVPMEEDLFYVWDAVVDDEPWQLGYREPYLEGTKELVWQTFRGELENETIILDQGKYGRIATAYAPICNSRGESVALAVVDLSVPDMNRAALDFMAHNSLFIILITLLATVLLLVYIKRYVADPIDRLSVAARRMVDDLDSEKPVEIAIRTGDEIQTLADSFVQMNVELRRYIRQLYAVTAEKERIGAELHVAAQIQASMLPQTFPPFPDREEFDIYATMTPAKEVGGDFYDFFLVDERHLAIVMADVSGKGIPAALFMAIGKTLLKDYTRPGRDLGEEFARVNQLLCEGNTKGMFITVFEGILDLVTGELRFVNAGHEPPFLSRGGGPFEAHKLRSGFVLAGMEGMRYRTGVLQMEPGDKLFQYTDGVTEATDGAQRLYGSERLKQTLDRAAHLSPTDILPAVKADVDAFVGDAPQFDDITMLCLEYKKPMQLPSAAKKEEESL